MASFGHRPCSCSSADHWAGLIVLCAGDVHRYLVMLGSRLLSTWVHRSTHRVVFALPARHVGRTASLRADVRFPASHFLAASLPSLLIFCLYGPVEALLALITNCIFLRAFAEICGSCGQFIGLLVSLNSDMGFHFQNSGLQALSCSGKKLSYYVLQHDHVFALLQGLWRVRI